MFTAEHDTSVVCFTILGVCIIIKKNTRSLFTNVIYQTVVRQNDKRVFQSMNSSVLYV